MNLRDFVSEAITTVAEGVRNAQKRGKELGLTVNPIARVFSTRSLASMEKGNSPLEFG